MKKTFAISILKKDVLMEDFSNVYEAIRCFSEDKEKLIEARNTWEVFFTGYDDDPREIRDIPEIVNWIEQSVEAGIPWFYFMSTKGQAMGLRTFLVCGGADHDLKYPERYFFDQDKIFPFIKKNLNNLADFVEEYDIPNEIGCAATDEIMDFINQLLNGTENEAKPAQEVNSDKMHNEALLRIEMLENLFGLNPNVRKYFKDGNLYYSYLTGGGYICSIDTINYKKHYADTVNSFEEQTASLVYHVIEHENTISLLYVSNDFEKWESERPASSGIKACVIDMNTLKGEFGYIKIDVLQGALYRKDSILYPSSPAEEYDESSVIDSEIVERLEILKNAGIQTDLDITKVYIQEGELCCSLLKLIMGIPVGLINRISSTPTYAKLLELLSEKTEKTLYFLMGSTGTKIAFLYLSNDPSDWEGEKLALEKKKPYAIVFDLEEMTAKIQQIKYDIINGGPIFLCD